MNLVNAPHLPVRSEWLALTAEPIIDPDLPIVDAHHHLWDRHGSRYLSHEMLADTNSGHRITSTVFVQCRSMLRSSGPAHMAPVGEVEFANGVAAMSASGTYGDTRLCDAIVGGADLTLGDDVCNVLEKMLDVSGGRLRGIRNPVAWHADSAVQSSPARPPDGLMGAPEFRAGVNRLSRYGLSLDVWAYHTQLSEVYALAKATPSVTIVVDHFGGPVGVGPYAGRRSEVFEAWRRQLVRLSELPNVCIKLGGAGMPVFGYPFASAPEAPTSMQLAEAWKPYFDTCVELFSPDRCMAESNFPVDKGMFSYHVLWNAFKRLTASLSVRERQAILSMTAQRIYGLATPSDAA